jgi:4-oxalmesaconate hydratase
VVPIDNILFASEMVGAVRGKDPQTGYDFDDTKRYVDGAPSLSAADKKKILEANALRAYPRLKSKLAARTAART